MSTGASPWTARSTARSTAALCLLACLSLWLVYLIGTPTFWDPDEATYAQASRGVQTVLKDVSQDKAEQGKAYSVRITQPRVDKGRMSPHDQAALLARITRSAMVETLRQDFIRTAKAIDSLKLEGDEAIGAQIVRRAIESPIRMLCANAGVEGAVVVGQIIANKGNYGYNVATGDYEDLVKAGVVDPTKVVRVALQDASSVAGLLITTEAMIAERKEPAKNEHAGHSHGGMPDMGGAGSTETASAEPKDKGKVVDADFEVVDKDK